MSKLIDKKTNSSENSNKEEKSQSKNDLYNCTKDSNSIVIENEVYCSSPKLGNSVIISCFHKSKSQIFTPSVLSERTQPTIITNLVNNLSSIVKNNNEENEKNNEIKNPEKCINSKQNIEHKNKCNSKKKIVTTYISKVDVFKIKKIFKFSYDSKGGKKVVKRVYNNYTIDKKYKNSNGCSVKNYSNNSISLNSTMLTTNLSKKDSSVC